MRLSTRSSPLWLRQEPPIKTPFQKGTWPGPKRGGEKPKGARRETKSSRKDLKMARPKKVQRIVDLQKGKAGLRVRNTRIKGHTFHMTRRQMILIVSMLLLIMGSSIGYVWSNFESTQIGYSLSQLKREEIRLRKIQQELRAELAYLRSPQRLHALAHKKLGLGQPSAGQIIVLK